MTKQGIFIAFEGIDGAGKSCQITKVKEWCQSLGYEVVVTREPGGTALGEKIRNLLLDGDNKGMSYLTELLLYAADRAQHIKEIILPNLDMGKVVISDRYTLSTIAYQGYGRNLDIATIEKLNDLATQGLEPNITIVIDISPEKGRERINNNRQEKPDRLEQEQNIFFNDVRQGYSALAAKSENIITVNGENTPKKVFSEIAEKLEPFLCTKN
ncbi:MAG: dTMP kinase [Clostridiales bacterium]